MLKFTGVSRLALKLLAQLIQQLRQTGVGSGHHPAMSVVHDGIYFFFLLVFLKSQKGQQRCSDSSSGSENEIATKVLTWAQ